MATQQRNNEKETKANVKCAIPKVSLYTLIEQSIKYQEVLKNIKVDKDNTPEAFNQVLITMMLNVPITFSYEDLMKL